MSVHERKFLRHVFFGAGPVLPESLRRTLYTPDETAWVSLHVQATSLPRGQSARPDPQEVEDYSFLCSTDNLMGVYREIQAELWRRGKLPLPDPAESDLVVP